jgi:hypothetical protein
MEMKSNDDIFVVKMIGRFGAGLRKALAAGTDTFSFEFQSHEVPGVKNAGIPDETMTMVVLMRPKAPADAMLKEMQEAREQIMQAIMEGQVKS